MLVSFPKNSKYKRILVLTSKINLRAAGNGIAKNWDSIPRIYKTKVTYANKVSSWVTSFVKIGVYNIYGLK